MTNLISCIFGKIASIKFPKKVQNFINKSYVNYFKIDMSEFKNYTEYRSLNELFTRTLTKKRELSCSNFISPSDGVVFQTGVSSEFKAFSIKGIDYNIKELLDEDIDDELKYLNIYLSPKDYHHYHSPCDLQILEAKYIPAKLYSVAKSAILKIPNLYAKNERVILKTKLENNKILWLVFVGALNVGKMKFNFDKNIQTNAKKGKNIYKYENLLYKKGEHLGNFELGSTIVILANQDSLNFDTQNSENIKFGQSLGEILS
ncbi:phosphatidylserine decarboxylase, proenzyme [Campylobacter blaseri]|uniref:phosphatidylserine decarboxylase n=1 Tax=Campylobacter blaseri TaxID=2042961 RepID=A0A2P8QZZ7_9BACT|nr:phosphatidylserine decarboxylase [Campylobacter blaseri]PSM51819.1 phosphatidylserine decarboxylase [Campylobacter blaseri]PSM53610.1 phosphatidylserine decarboxylase [Campylobacter blaseri]QKF86422.1 phosphatidylserine decarboxylase, proenzyme [Campylobacter blaseri]